MTDGQRKHDQFLEKASEADAEAARTSDTLLQVSWRKIAENYRALARCEGLLNPPNFSYFRRRPALAGATDPANKETTQH